MENKKLKIYHFLANLKIALKRQESVFVFKNNIKFKGWEKVLRELYAQGHISGYRSKGEYNEIYISTYKRKLEIEKLEIYMKEGSRQKMVPYMKKSFEHNNPRTTGFIRNRKGLKTVKESKFEGEFLFYIK